MKLDGEVYFEMLLTCAKNCDDLMTSSQVACKFLKMHIFKNLYRLDKAFSNDFFSAEWSAIIEKIIFGDFCSLCRLVN